MVQASWGKEVERLRQSLLQQGQKLEAAQQRVGELETQLTKKEHLIVEQKKFLEDVKGQAKYVRSGFRGGKGLRLICIKAVGLCFSVQMCVLA